MGKTMGVPDEDIWVVTARALQGRLGHRGPFWWRIEDGKFYIGDAGGEEQRPGDDVAKDEAGVMVFVAALQLSA